jgi:hypothetical protein
LIFEIFAGMSIGKKPVENPGGSAGSKFAELLRGRYALLNRDIFGLLEEAQNTS